MAWIKCTKEKFEEYGIVIDTQRMLSDGEYINHVELSKQPDFFIDARLDLSVKMFNEEQMEALTANEDSKTLATPESKASKIAEVEQLIFTERDSQAISRAEVMTLKLEAIELAAMGAVKDVGAEL